MVAPISLPEDRTVYCKDAYGQYVKVVEEYYRRAIGTSDGVVSGPSDIMLMEDDENFKIDIYLRKEVTMHIYTCTVSHKPQATM